ncbi:MAG TPA: hypothetical protein VFQ22_07325 [Longimicrobiales bacterium]|nr:hypothetical protein [Longimicrobiales bacterium]
MKAHRVKVGILLAALTLAAGACDRSAGDAAAAADTLTRRQKDEIIATMPVPGASAVGRALEAQDAAAARAERLERELGN